jgi:hypothetical protein
MSWAITDRVTRVNFYLVLLGAAAALAPVLVDRISLILMAAVLMLVYQAWRLAMARQVQVTIDDTGIRKTIGTRTWHLDWAQAQSAQLNRFLGTDQLVLSTGEPTRWNSSDKLYFVLSGNQVAVQVPPSLLAPLRELFDQRGLPIS